MKNYFKILVPVLVIIVVVLISCNKTEHSFGDIKTPTGLSLSTVLTGKDNANINGDGSGKISITATSNNALSYKIDYGDGVSELVPSGVVTHKYTNTGTNTYTVTVNAIGTGGAMSTLSKQITVLVLYELPADVLQNLTGGNSKVWVTDKDAVGHFGVGPITSFGPDWYAAPANTREACAYDDEITFAKSGTSKVMMTVDNKGASFSTGAATSFYGLSGGDNCYAINTGGSKQLSFSAATSGSTSANSTLIEFTVPGNGIINFGTGGTKYEIISLTATTIMLRNIGADGNAWYQKLRVK